MLHLYYPPINTAKTHWLFGLINNLLYSTLVTMYRKGQRAAPEKGAKEDMKADQQIILTLRMNPSLYEGWYQKKDLAVDRGGEKAAGQETLGVADREKDQEEDLLIHLRKSAMNLITMTKKMNTFRRSSTFQMSIQGVLIK